MKTCRGIRASELKESEIQKWEQKHWEYMQSLPEKFDILQLDPAWSKEVHAKRAKYYDN